MSTSPTSIATPFISITHRIPHFCNRPLSLDFIVPFFFHVLATSLLSSLSISPSPSLLHLTFYCFYVLSTSNHVSIMFRLWAHCFLILFYNLVLHNGHDITNVGWMQGDNAGGWDCEADEYADTITGGLPMDEDRKGWSCSASFSDDVLSLCYCTYIHI